MLRITAQKSAAQVQSYYRQSDYYEGGKDAKGQWFGKGATLLGLSGEVEKAPFDRIVENTHPFNDENLTPKTLSNRRIGWDFTFSVPKSVSLAWAFSDQDPRYLKVIREAVDKTLEEIQKDVQTRVHAGKKMHLERTDNIIAATFLHKHSRPVNSVSLPGLHMHAWIANATARNCDGEFRAMDIAAVKKDAPYCEARFHNRLADKLGQEFGVGIERQGKKWFEISRISRELIERFSERT